MKSAECAKMEYQQFSSSRWQRFTSFAIQILLKEVYGRLGENLLLISDTARLS